MERIMKKIYCLLLFTWFWLPVIIFSQNPSGNSSTLPVITNVEPQPLMAQATRLEDALSFLGNSLLAEDVNRLKALQNKPLTDETTKLIQDILDPYCLAMVDINPEARVKVLR